MVDNLLDELAEAVVLADVEDIGGMQRLVVLLESGLAAVSSAGPELVAPLQKARAQVLHLLAEGEAAADLLTSLAEALRAVQQGVERARTAAAPASATPAVPSTGEAVVPAAGVAAPGGVLRDPDTLELMGEFLEESSGLLERADETLMAVEANGATDEHINELFRAFHSIKGVGGFIDLTQVCAVAHITETLLNYVREGRAPLAGQVLDRVFDATGVMRKLLVEVQRALEDQAALRDLSEVAPLVAREEALIAEIEAGTFVVGGEPEPGGASLSQDEAPQGSDRRTGEDATSKRAGLRETLKVDVGRVDSVVEMIGELIIVESMVVNAPELAELGSLRLRQHLAQLTKISRDLQDVAMRMRMVPVRSVFQRMSRLTRDLSRKTGKRVSMVIQGEDTEMDRSMVERIEEPLVHMVRNAVDHGVESPEARRAQGKPAEAVLTLAARHEGGNVVISLTDDGKGLNTTAILDRARSRGLVKAGETPPDETIWSLIFDPGFSTAEKVTEISGRGVGLDVVKRTIESLRGRIQIHSEAGKGTSFRLVLPLTLAIIDGMLVACGEERFIIPSLAIVESLQPTLGMVHAVADETELVDVRGDLLPLIRVGRRFAIPTAVDDPFSALLVIVESAGKRVALMVDDVVAQQQVVIKPIGAGIGQTDCFIGAAILSDGRVGLILNVDQMVQSATRGAGNAPIHESSAPSTELYA